MEEKKVTEEQQEQQPQVAPDAQEEAPAAEEHKTSETQTETPNDNPEGKADWDKIFEIKRLRRAMLIEKATKIGYTIVAISLAPVMIGWAWTGHWLQAFNNAMWIFIAYCTYRHAKKSETYADVAMQFLCKTAILQERITRYEKQVAILEKIDTIRTEQLDCHNEMNRNYKEALAIRDNLLDKQRDVIDKQDDQIHGLECQISILKGTDKL